MRFVPTTRSSLATTPAEQVGVAGQVWVNNADLQFGSVPGCTDCQRRRATCRGALVYSATYTVTVTGVPGYALANSTTFVAGNSGDVEFTLTPLVAAANLTVAYISNQSPVPAGSATLTI